MQPITLKEASSSGTVFSLLLDTSVPTPIWAGLGTAAPLKTASLLRWSSVLSFSLTVSPTLGWKGLVLLLDPHTLSSKSNTFLLRSCFGSLVFLGCFLNPDGSEESLPQSCPPEGALLKSLPPMPLVLTLFLHSPSV